MKPLLSDKFIHKKNHCFCNVVNYASSENHPQSLRIWWKLQLLSLRNSQILNLITVQTQVQTFLKLQAKLQR